MTLSLPEVFLPPPIMEGVDGEGSAKKKKKVSSHKLLMSNMSFILATVLPLEALPSFVCKLDCVSLSLPGGLRKLCVCVWVGRGLGVGLKRDLRH